MRSLQSIHASEQAILDAYLARRERAREQLRVARRELREAKLYLVALMAETDGTSQPEEPLRNYERALRKLIRAEDASL